MRTRLLVALLLPVHLLAVATCRDASTAVTGPSPPPGQPPSVVTPTRLRANLLADPLTVLITDHLGKNPAGLRNGVPFSYPAEPLDSADVLILQATLDLILQTADSLPADTGTGGQQARRRP